MKKISALSVFLCIAIACALISCVTLGCTLALNTGIFYGTNAVTTKAQNFYAISVANANNSASLQEEKLLLQSRGGAGYIFCKDSTYYLLASLYNNLPDAELVKSNLLSQDVQSEIVKITLPAQKVSGNFEKKEVLQECLNSSQTSYMALYNTAISLDTNVFSISEAKLECINIYSSAIAVKTNFESFFGNSNLDFLAEKLCKNMCIRIFNY